MMASVKLHYTLLFTFLSSIIAVVGFSVDLIHRDSVVSPLHNPAKTHWERLNDALRRSATRAQSSVVAAKGEYLMNISVGSPPVTLLGIADTGSDLTWTQCKPCVQCYEQSLPIFDPKKSSSFKTIPCGSPLCYTNLATKTCSADGACSYYYSYGDKSYTNGVLASETVTFATFTFPHMLIGCGHDNGGTFNDQGSGIIGLGGGALSLVTQMKPTVGAKFSYCLVPFYNTSLVGKITFGPEALFSGSAVVSTPLVKKKPSTFYYLTLESVGIGNVIFDFKRSKSEYAHFVEEGNIIIDSGTTLTLLPQEFYNDLEAEMKKNIRAEPVEDPEGVMSLCYNNDEDMDVPIVKMRFAGAEIQLKSSNTFVKVQEDVVCFAMIPATEVAIFGNLAQMDFLVGYDLEQGKVSFKPANCSQLK